MKIRLAGVQPRAGSGPGEARNAEDALAWVDRAADAGADLVVFPEGYPGPTNPVNHYDAFTPLAKRARERRVHVVGGRVEPAGDGRHHYVTLHLIDDRGQTLGVYRRSTPRGPYVYRDIPAWEFDYIESPDADLPVFDTRLGRIGLQVCSEVYSTEQSRVLAMRGADVILYPAGGAINELLPAWRAMIWARAIENLVYTVAVQNLYADGEQGVGTIAGPEEVLAQDAGAGMLVADLDLDRLEFLRAEDERVEYPRRYRTVPGVLRWRRPEVIAEFARDQAERAGGPPV